MPTGHGMCPGNTDIGNQHMATWWTSSSPCLHVLLSGGSQRKGSFDLTWWPVGGSEHRREGVETPANISGPPLLPAEPMISFIWLLTNPIVPLSQRAKLCENAPRAVKGPLSRGTKPALTPAARPGQPRTTPPTPSVPNPNCSPLILRLRR